MRSESQHAEVIAKDVQKRKAELNRKRASNGQESQDYDSSSDEGEEYYEVEKILDMKVSRNGKRQFFVSNF